MSAGTLTVGGTLSGSISYPPPSSGWYSPPLGTSLFAPGAALTVSATGAVVPAFAGLEIQGPLTVEMSWPKPIPTDQDLHLSWTGGQPGDGVWVSFYPQELNGPSTACTFDAATGQGTVPQAALAPVVGVSSGMVSWAQTVSSSFTLGGWTIQLQAWNQLFVAISYQ